MTITVLIADDAAMVRAGFAALLDAQEDLRVVGQVADGKEAVAQAARLRPDVILMDVRMPEMNGIEATERIGAPSFPASPPPRILMLTTFDIDDYVHDALQAGASGFLLKDTPPQDLARAVHVVAGGEAMLSPTVTRRMLSHFSEANPGSRQERHPGLDQLTERETEVLGAVGAGLSNAQIGMRLFMSEATVKAHVSKIFAKLDCTNRVQIAIIAHEAGLSDLDADQV